LTRQSNIAVQAAGDCSKPSAICSPASAQGAERMTIEMILLPKTQRSAEGSEDTMLKAAAFGS
jgi:hypothetical protein